MDNQTNPYFTYTLFKAKAAHKTVFLFPAGFTKLLLYRYTIRQMNARGVDVIGFDFNWRHAVRHISLEDLKSLLQQIENFITSYINECSDKSHTFGVFGASFGSVIALYVAKNNKRIDSIILVVPHATLAKVLWTHKPSKPFKNTLQHAGIDSEEKLYIALDTIEPRSQINRLKNKRIVSFVGLNDRIVQDGKTLSTALTNSGAKTRIYYNKRGHFVAGTLGILNVAKWEYLLQK